MGFIAKPPVLAKQCPNAAPAAPVPQRSAAGSLTARSATLWQNHAKADRANADRVKPDLGQTHGIA
jgi:hypothetical protein